MERFVQQKPQKLISSKIKYSNMHFQLKTSLTSAEFAFLFMVSNLYVLYIDSELILRPVNTSNFMVLVRIQSNIRRFSIQKFKQGIKGFVTKV